jgi:hypothetical protein
MQAYDVHAIVIFPFRVEAENEYQAERILEAALPDLLKKVPRLEKGEAIKLDTPHLVDPHYIARPAIGTRGLHRER